MSTTIMDGPAIVAGYDYTLRIEADAPLFPTGCTLVGQVRSKITSATIIATVDTAGGGLVRVADNTIDLNIAGSATASLPAGTVIMDVVRTDLTPERHLSFNLEIPVVLPVTRGA